MYKMNLQARHPIAGGTRVVIHDVHRCRTGHSSGARAVLCFRLTFAADGKAEGAGIHDGLRFFPKTPRGTGTGTLTRLTRLVRLSIQGQIVRSVS